MNNRHRLYITQLAMNGFDLLKETEQFDELMRYLVNDLCYFPLQGRLLLNRCSNNAEVSALIKSLAIVCQNKDIREFIFQQWLIIYLSYRSNVYLLNLISLKNTSSEIISMWQE
jgi:hypothetical protein